MNIYKVIVAFLVAVFCLTGSPAQARFLQVDPLGYQDDLDLYTYVHNDPTDKIDPTGLCDDVNGCGPPAAESQAILATPAGMQGQAGGVTIAVGLGAVAYDASAALAGGAISTTGYGLGQLVTSAPITASGATNAFVTGEVGAITSSKTAIQATVAMAGNAIGQVGETGHIQLGQVAVSGVAAVVAERSVPPALLKNLPGVVQAGANIVKNIASATIQNVLPKLPSSLLKQINGLQNGNSIGGARASCSVKASGGTCSTGN